jgi:hypothetical protein
MLLLLDRRVLIVAVVAAVLLFLAIPFHSVNVRLHGVIHCDDVLYLNQPFIVATARPLLFLMALSHSA